MKYFILLLSVCWNSISMGASSIAKGSFDGKQIRWTSAFSIQGDDHIVPSHWDIAGKLMPTSEWLPGGFYTPPPPSILMHGPIGSVYVDISLIGLQYNAGGATPSTGSPSTGTVCTDAIGSGAMVTLSGSNCYYKESLVNTPPKQPYAFIRPVFHIDPAELELKLDGQDSGLYRGTVMWSNFYDYVFDSSGVYTRQINTHHLVIEIDYEAAYITNVDLIGDGIIKTTYNHQEQVSGTTNFQGLVTGKLPSGVKLSLKDANRDYELVKGTSSSIPYSVDCLGCADTSLVSNGSVVNSETTIPSSNGLIAPFSLTVGFDNVDLVNIEEGDHYDSFILIFEPNI
ncbi:hypothetical protein GCM10007916_28660 [Psychromonas marina]|uniref:Uncharacterized protein n=1 Tax=Psychromonas marina TaxID=88364 RepID=A0ABQ6E317_9GAMM|nr:hypothetical protein [Psychromonas marina]GLS91796.1 hypothetical protein GCM10007916_28660 [Psychromonas marina]